MKTPEMLYAKLMDNCQGLLVNVITYEQFRANQRPIWDEIEAAGLRDEVCALIDRDRNRA